MSTISINQEMKEDEVYSSAPVLVSRHDVHKNFDKNVFLSSITRQIDTAGQVFYKAKVRIVSDHPYFFEHSREHLPGLYIIEAGRQVGLAIPHLFYDVGYDYGFVLSGCDMNFSGFINLADDLHIDCRISNLEHRRGKLQSLSFEGLFIQNGDTRVHYRSHIKLIHQKLLARYEKQSA